MQISRYLQLGSAFEIAGSSRMLPLEGLRAIAVTLVFVQHYCMQFITYGHLSGLTLNIAIIGRNFGNCGVELFFVLSGFLIYGILLRRRPPFFDFMGRRLQRLYPAFLVSVVLGVIIDFWRPIPKIPGDFTNAVTYLAENLLFLPGLLPMDAVSAPNWSLSYEWWFYTTATLLFSVLGLARLRPAARISIILAFAAVLLGLSANNVPNVPVRGLCLLAGMLLAEAKAAKLPPLSGGLGVGLGFSAFIAYNWVLPPVWIGALLLAFGFSLVCCVAVDNRSIFSTWLTWSPLRHFGNMSYSYYLVHGFVVVPAARIVVKLAEGHDLDLFFWATMAPIFVLSWVVGAALFLTVEKPWSLSKPVPAVSLGRQGRAIAIPETASGGNDP